VNKDKITREEQIRKLQAEQVRNLQNPRPAKPPSSKSTQDNQPTISIESILKSTGVVSFVADCIAIFVFIQQLLGGQSLPPSERMISLAIVIILAFVLSISLIKFSKENTGSIFSLFGIVYAIYGAVFVSIIYFQSISGRINNSQFGGYFILGIIIAGFSYVVMKGANISMEWAAIPYILAGIINIGFVIFKVAAGDDIPFMSHFALILSILCVVIFLGFDQYIPMLLSKNQGGSK
jgi:hypothetical protein